MYLISLLRVFHIFLYCRQSLWYLYLLHTSVPVYAYSIPACSILKCCEIVTPSAFSLFVLVYVYALFMVDILIYGVVKVVKKERTTSNPVIFCLFRFYII